jgi:hypothetical protein
MNTEQCGVRLRLSKNQMLSQDLCVANFQNNKEVAHSVLLRHQRSKKRHGLTEAA